MTPLPLPLGRAEMLVVHGNSGTLGVVKAGIRRQFFVDTPGGEYVLALAPEDIIVASGFGTGDRIVRGLRCVLYMIRELNSPFVVLPPEHPASSRLIFVVSAGRRVRLSCRIKPGTHPEQDLLCGMPEFEGVEILAVEGGVELKGLATENYEHTSFEFG